ncbi:MAG: LytR C-terminal domain-containing protein [Micropruina sp.]|nr:LytR C-terminal domain-containing protein [Micropruina sp.]
MRDVIRVLKTPLTLLALIALVVVGGTWGWANAMAPVPPRPPAPCVVQTIGPKLTPDKVTLRILNGGFQGGLAKRASLQMRAYGFNVIKVNNTDRRIQKTTIIGYAADSPEVLLVAGFFKDPVIEVDARADHSVDVLLGSVFPGYVTKPAQSVPLADGTACLPAPAVTASPSASPSASPKPSTTPSK